MPDEAPRAAGEAGTLFLPRRLAIRLLHEAQQAPDSEVCGLIGAAADGAPASVYPVGNVARDAATRFELDAAQRAAALKRMRDCGETLWAVYHSHPASPPAPSAADLQGWGHPEVRHLIVALDTKGVLKLTCWMLESGQPRERVLKVLENT